MSTKGLSESYSPNLSWQTFWVFSMVTWQVSVPFSPRGYDGFTKTVSFWFVVPPQVNLKEQQVPKPLAHGPMPVPARRAHSASAKQVPLSPLSPLHAVFWKRTIERIPGSDGGRKTWPSIEVARSEKTSVETKNSIYMIVEGGVGNKRGRRSYMRLRLVMSSLDQRKCPLSLLSEQTRTSNHKISRTLLLCFDFWELKMMRH